MTIIRLIDATADPVPVTCRRRHDPALRCAARSQTHVGVGKDLRLHAVEFVQDHEIGVNPGVRARLIRPHEVNDPVTERATLDRFCQISGLGRVAQPRRRRDEETPMICPHCRSSATTRRKHRTALGYPRFNGRLCGRRFNERTGTLWLCQISDHETQRDDVRLDRLSLARRHLRDQPVPARKEQPALVGQRDVRAASTAHPEVLSQLVNRRAESRC